MSRSSSSWVRHRPRAMMAMVLGTALSAFSPVASAGDTSAIQDISRYCTACWRNARLHPDRWSDCTQEVFCRLLERVAPDAWERILKDEGQERRELIRAVDTVKKRTQRARRPLSTSLEMTADSRIAGQQRRAEERDMVRQAAEHVLTARQQHILERSLDGWSVQEIARDMGIGPERISDEKYKAIHKLRDYLQGVG